MLLCSKLTPVIKEKHDKRIWRIAYGNNHVKPPAVSYILKRYLDRRVRVVSRFACDKVASGFCRISPRKFYHIDLSSEVQGYKVAWATVRVVVSHNCICLKCAGRSIRYIILVVLPPNT